MHHSRRNAHDRHHRHPAEPRARWKKGALPDELVKLERLLTRALHVTAERWAPIQRAFAWVHQAAHILNNADQGSGANVRLRLRGLVAAITRWRPHVGELAPALTHFLKVTRSYWSGLFHCYDAPDLPRTNNDLEHVFGAHRYHERRATGRKGASPTLVVRGAARLIAAVATRRTTFTAMDLATANRQDWQQLRAELAQRQQGRVHQRRFRRNPQAYLADLEDRLVKLLLPT